MQRLAWLSVLASSMVLGPLLSDEPVFAQGIYNFYMEFTDAQAYVPPDGNAAGKIARLTARVRIGPQQTVARLMTANFELKDRSGKPIPVKMLFGPLRKADVPVGPGETAVEFDAALYGAALAPNERYMLRGIFPDGLSFGRPVRFEKSADPLPEEPWEKEAAAPPKAKRKK